MKTFRYHVRSPDGRAIFGCDRLEAATAVALEYRQGPRLLPGRGVGHRSPHRRSRHDRGRQKRSRGNRSRLAKGPAQMPATPTAGRPALGGRSRQREGCRITPRARRRRRCSRWRGADSPHVALKKGKAAIGESSRAAGKRRLVAHVLRRCPHRMCARPLGADRSLPLRRVAPASRCALPLRNWLDMRAFMSFDI